eukprot:1161296-Pelagomonas_calceolata.AAC.9
MHMEMGGIGTPWRCGCGGNNVGRWNWGWMRKNKDPMLMQSDITSCSATGGGIVWKRKVVACWVALSGSAG